MEGTALGVPSIALSQAFGLSTGREIDWSCADTHGPAVVKKLISIGWPADVLMNINFPDGDANSVRGVEVTAQGKRDLQTAMLDRRIDARGVPYYWIGFKRGRSQPPEGTDLKAIHKRRISVSPLHLNLTEFHERERLKPLLETLKLQV
jgi:5'-nucleotidase